MVVVMSEGLPQVDSFTHDSNFVDHGQRSNVLFDGTFVKDGNSNLK